MPLYIDDDGTSTSSTCGGRRHERRHGTALHPRRWHAPVGQVGPRLHRVRHRRRASRARRRGLAWKDIQFVAGADTIRNGYPGFIAGSTFAQKLGWNGVRVSRSYAACAAGPRRSERPRPDPGRLLRRCARHRRRHHAQGVLRARSAESAGTIRTGSGSTSSAPPTRCTSRCSPAGGWISTARRRGFRPGQGQEQPPRSAQSERARSTRRTRSTTCWTARSSADPLRLLDICATSDGARRNDRRQHGRSPRSTSARAKACRRRGGWHRDTAISAEHASRLPDIASDSAAVVLRRIGEYKDSIAGAHTSKRASGPRTSNLAEVYDLSTALESTGTSTSVSAPRVKPSGSCAPAPPPSAVGFPSTPAAVWRASARRFPRRRSHRCASSCGSSRDKPPRQVAGARSDHRQPGPLRPRQFGHRRANHADRQTGPPLAVQRRPTPTFRRSNRTGAAYGYREPASSYCRPRSRPTSGERSRRPASGRRSARTPDRCWRRWRPCRRRSTAR